MAVTEEILGQFLGDESFPVDWASDDRAGLLLGLRRPAHPASGQPDVLRHRRLVAELRPHVPAVRDALRRRLAGQERQRLRLHDGHPRGPRPAHRGHRVQLALRRPGAARPRLRRDDGRVSRHRPAGLRPALRRLVARPAGPGDAAQLRLPRGASWIAADGMSLAETATLLEDAIDIHDRHWKIHWMLNFAQLSATLDLRAVMERTRGDDRRGRSSVGCRTRPRTGTGTRSRRCGG